MLRPPKWVAKAAAWLGLGFGFKFAFGFGFGLGLGLGLGLGARVRVRTYQRRLDVGRLGPVLVGVLGGAGEGGGGDAQQSAEAGVVEPQPDVSGVVHGHVEADLVRVRGRVRARINVRARVRVRLKGER